MDLTGTRKGAESFRETGPAAACCSGPVDETNISRAPRFKIGAICTPTPTGVLWKVCFRVF